MTDPDRPGVYAADFDAQIPLFLDQHREMLAASLHGLTEEEARMRLVASKTTLLGLVKHATFAERVWFGQAPTGTSRSELGIVETADESFDLGDDDTIESVLADFAAACDDSRSAAAGLGHDTVWSGNKRGPLTLRWIELHVLREHAQHCGHADILREQLLAARPRRPSGSVSR